MVSFIDPQETTDGRTGIVVGAPGVYLLVERYVCTVYNPSSFVSSLALSIFLLSVAFPITVQKILFVMVLIKV